VTLTGSVGVECFGYSDESKAYRDEKQFHNEAMKEAFVAYRNEFGGGWKERAA